MAGAFLYLAACSVRNRIRVRVHRLREPRYFIGLAIGVAYVGLVLTRPPRPRPMPGSPVPDLDGLEAFLTLIGAAGLLAATALAWVLPGTGRPALTFSQADVQFLFTAPVTRRELLHYKMLRSQGGALIGSALVTLLFRPHSVVEAWTFFLGTLLVMATANLHLTGVSLRRESLRAHGAAGLVRQWAPLAIVIGAVAIVASAVVAHWSEMADVASLEELTARMDRITVSWPVRAVLWPFSALMRLPLSGSASAFAAALPFGIAAFLANYLWVLRSDVAFEEAAARDAERQVARRAGPSLSMARRRAAPFALAAVGRPEAALLWKNLILATRYASWGMFWRLLPILALGAFIVAQAARSVADGLAAVCTIGAVGVVFIGPQILRNDLRQDLTQIATFKSWPVSGATIVRGEVLAPTVILTAIVWLLLVAAAVLWGSVTFATDLTLGDRASYALAGMFVAPGVILIEVVVQNALVVMFPAWMDLGGSSARGMEVMGQRMLIAGALVIAVGIALVPAVVAAAFSIWSLFVLLGTPTIVVPSIVAGAVLVAEALLIVQRLGTVVDGMDASAVPAAD